MAYLTVPKVAVILHIRQQDISQLSKAVTARFAVEGLAPVGALHIFVNPASPLPPLGISAQQICRARLLSYTIPDVPALGGSTVDLWSTIA